MHVNYYSHSCEGNNSKHRQLCLDFLIVLREPLHRGHISEWENEEEPMHWDN
jgi:hypothetical protein